MDAKQVIDLLSQAHTCVWVQGRLITLLSWVLALSGQTVRVVFGWRSLHHTESKTQGWGLGVLVWTGTWAGDRRVVGWSYLWLGYKRGVCFGVPSWAH